MRCRWCHNPETQSAANEIIYSPVKCIRCGRCIEVCPEYHRVKNGAMEFLRAGCSGCGRCAEACPSGALSSAGREETAENVVKEVLKDRRFY
ncbi:MAG: 4Fe-4S dicluster domain-containing protein, partial [Abditibacteriota bacterium]|nr:4Fe-4S dicluster domain-containing protein [Abditibacteriota bacterium]